MLNSYFLSRSSILAMQYVWRSEISRVKNEGSGACKFHC